MPIYRIQFFHFPDRSSKWWAFKQMQLCPPEAQRQKGILFFKMLGSGAGQGFSIWPDWSTYAQLSIWQDEEAYLAWQRSKTMQVFSHKSNGMMELDLSPYQSKGTWNGLRPFKSEDEAPNTALMAVLTRASIKSSELVHFWRSVPKVSRIMQKQESLVFQKGVGEWPLVEQATFSVWNAEKAMKDFAYQQKEHRKVVQLTRKRDWYKEEQFTRFGVLAVRGQWPNSDFNKLKSHILNG